MTLTREEVNELLRDKTKLEALRKKKLVTRKSKRPSFEELFTKYVIDGRTADDVCQDYEVTPVTVRRWFSEMKRARIKEIMLEDYQQQQSEGVTA